jgi:prolyl-tRNA editing enzyme YbaK/EbsC (Cys-tRNA(Pro) deacylase)
MSKSVARVARALTDAGLLDTIAEVGQARTAEEAAQVCGCALDQIVKSLIFQGQTTGRVHLFLTAGGSRINSARAAIVAGEPLARADADLVRNVTGFAIGGVAPIGHLSPCPVWADPRLLDFDTVFAAAGTPRHVFKIAPAMLISAAHATLAEFTA